MEKSNKRYKIIKNAVERGDLEELDRIIGETRREINSILAQNDWARGHYGDLVQYSTALVERWVIETEDKTEGTLRKVEEKREK